MNSHYQDKSFIRTHFINLRKQIPIQTQADLSQLASEIFLDNIKILNSDIVAGFYPINNEISPLHIIKTLWGESITTSLPAITNIDQHLVFKKWQRNDSLIEGRFGIKEATGPILVPTIIIVPLVAFDIKGNRLGYGGGYYDRTLIKLKKSGHNFISIGFAYGTQESQHIPTHCHDISLDYIVTDKEFIAV
jgi:5-formyltetrahydrofolate cyclo-ligase